MVRRTCEEQTREENQKEDAEEKPTRRRKNRLNAKWRKKTPGKKTDFQTAGFPPLSFRR